MARAATIAELRGWAPLVGLQVEYSLVERTPERELLPMAQALGLGTVGCSPLGGGLLTGKYRRGEKGRAATFKRLIHSESDPIKTRTVDALLAVTDEAGVAPSAVALGWIRVRGVIPILGPRTADQLRDNFSALGFTLSEGQFTRLDAASAIPLGFPHDMLASDFQKTRLATSIPADVDSPVVPVP